MVKSIGVIGAGQMGGGIAHVAALAGFEVMLADVGEEQLTRALAIIEKNMARQARKGLIDESQVPAAMARFKTATDYAFFKDCEVVIEAATENEELKKKIFADLCPMLPAETILCSNTSSISITRLGAATDRPERFMGMHFMNPVPLMDLVELIRGIATDKETFDKMREVTLKLGKNPVNAEDFPAFIVNRILVPMLNEAIYTLYEGVGNVAAIDEAMRLGANHPMGPLQLADFIGLDTILAVMNVLYDGLADSKYRPCPLLVKYVDAGWLGRKTAKGFYDYTGDEPVPTR